MGGGDVPEIVLESVDEPRRAFLKKLILGSAFVIPSVASFSMAGLSVGEAAVMCSNLIGQNLHGCDFSNRDFFLDNVSGANLQGANFSNSACDVVNFSGANLNRANLTGARFSQCNFTGATLQGATLTGADLSSSTLTGANLTNANLTNATLDMTILTGANFQNAVGLMSVNWGDHTVCPDGTNSGADGGTCLGHL